jgi:hypothetical protein
MEFLRALIEVRYAADLQGEAEAEMVRREGEFLRKHGLE